MLCFYLFQLIQLAVHAHGRSNFCDFGFTSCNFGLCSQNMVLRRLVLGDNPTIALTIHNLMLVWYIHTVSGSWTQSHPNVTGCPPASVIQISLELWILIWFCKGLMKSFTSLCCFNRTSRADWMQIRDPCVRCDQLWEVRWGKWSMIIIYNLSLIIKL